jgi:tetratricopeptide (TPR) repeat protein
MSRAYDPLAQEEIMRRTLIASLAAVTLCATFAAAQGLSVPPSGDNQKASVSQNIGLVKVTIDYSSPDVHAPTGEDRRGKIWGGLVPYGLVNLGFGTCKECPWRAGANENTVFTVSDDVKVEGQPLRAGSYGLHMIPGQEDWTIVFSNNSTSWGSFFYDPAEDALRVKVKPSKNEYHEWLTYEFTDREPDKATVALKWEDLQVPINITVDDPTTKYLARIREELRDSPGFSWTNWVAAAQYALQAKRPNDALEFADAAVNRQFIGQENFQTLNTLATAQEAAGKTAESKATRDKAMNHATAAAIDLHQYGRQLLTQGKKEEALKVWELNAKRHPNMWPVNVGLARGYSAVGRYKDALKYAKLASVQAPDDVNKKSLEAGIKKLEQNQDWN